MKKSFFKFNNKFENCPNFLIKNYEEEKYVYLNYKNSYFRLVKFSKNISIKLIWIKLLEKNNLSYQLYIDTSNYNKLFKKNKKNILIRHKYFI